MWGVCVFPRGATGLGGLGERVRWRPGGADWAAGGLNANIVVCELRSGRLGTARVRVRVAVSVPRALGCKETGKLGWMLRKISLHSWVKGVGVAGGRAGSGDGVRRGWTSCQERGRGDVCGLSTRAGGQTDRC